jgi:hypothetical protein
VRFVVDKLALGQVFAESFGSPLSISFHHCFTFSHVSSGGWTMEPLAAQLHTGIVSQHYNNKNINSDGWLRPDKYESSPLDIHATPRISGVRTVASKIMKLPH